ncbi:hydrogenase maturation nickel metallochaperone HypA [Thermogutta sp.]|uniref:hydrogenase maturation nickel metallochaperone HypA/HybF n=1 Tax=Thermogutta sp. TaxID=1962930 RepID=UPI00321FF86C
MHEVAIVESLLQSIQEHVRDCGVSGRVRRVEVVIGKLSGVVPEAFRFAFEVLSPDVLGPGCELVVHETAAVCRCRQCGAVSELSEMILFCPRCQSDDVLIEGGRDLLLQSIELDEEAESGNPGPTDVNLDGSCPDGEG